jgi:Carboxypeptidase regulatory-like domain/Tetratricopeptide repeat
MRRLPSWKASLALFALSLLFCLPAAAQIFQNDDNTLDPTIGMANPRRNRFTVSGDVRNDATGNSFQRLQINIRSDDGRTYLATMTDDTGRFVFDNLPAGNYTVTASLIGYSTAEERVVIDNSPVMGVQLRLRSIAADASAPENSGPTISAHELSAPSKAKADMVKGQNLLYNKADYQGSIKEFQRAIKEFPDYYEAYGQMGVACARLKDSANAEASLRKSVDLSGQKYPQAYISLAALLSENHRFSDAEPMARKALELDSNSWQSYAELTRALAGLNRLTDAAESAQAAIKLQPNEPELYVALINIEGKLSNYPAMLENMNAYLSLAPDGRAAGQIRAMRAQIQQALAKANSPTPAQ